MLASSRSLKFERILRLVFEKDIKQYSLACAAITTRVCAVGVRFGGRRCPRAAADSTLYGVPLLVPS